MILKGNRQEELLSRASHRTVTTFIEVLTPVNGNGIEPAISFEDGKPAFSLTLTHPFNQRATCWQIADTCIPLIAKDPVALKKISDDLKQRTQRLESGELANLTHQQQIAVFESVDIVNKATGIAPQIRIDFSSSSCKEDADRKILELPFEKVKVALFDLNTKLSDVGGSIRAVELTHTPTMSAMDYYEIALTRYRPGHKIAYGDVLLGKAQRALMLARNPNQKLAH